MRPPNSPDLRSLAIEKKFSRRQLRKAAQRDRVGNFRTS
jgi:hypothetical protein